MPGVHLVLMTDRSEEDCFSPTALCSEAPFVASCLVSSSAKPSCQGVRLEKTTAFALTTHGRVHTTPSAQGNWAAGLEPQSHRFLAFPFWEQDEMVMKPGSR